MNAPQKIAFLPDIQSQVDRRQLHIDAVGVKGVRYPITIRAGQRVVPTIANLAMTVGLAAPTKGYVVEAENYESIHNHSAFARIVKPRKVAWPERFHP